MTVVLPTEEDQHRPFYRVLICNDWLHQTWVVLPMVQRYDSNTAGNGVEVMEWDKVSLPDVPKAKFRYRFGMIDNQQYAIPPDYSDVYVRIQVAQGNVAMGHGGSAIYDWKTVWLGTVEYQEDHLAPGASYAIGERIYHCVGIIAGLKRQKLNHHGYSFDGHTATPCYGALPYNYSKTDGSLGGNKGTVAWAPTSALAYDTYCHSWWNDGSFWTDLEVADHALLAAQSSILPNTAPVFVVGGATDLLNQAPSVHNVSTGMSAFAAVASILDRRRGRGCAFVTWADDSGNPTGPMPALELTVFPQVADDITYTPPKTGGTVTIPGANSLGTSIPLVDLQGDHRNIASTFQLGDRHQTEYGYVEVVGEPIEIAVTLDYFAGSIEPGWTASEATAWKTALDSGTTIRDENGVKIHLAAAAPQHAYVYQRHTIAHDKPCDAGNGNTAAVLPYDYVCDDDGNIAPSIESTSPLSCVLMHDMCVPNPCADQSHGVVRDRARAFVNNGISDTYLDVQQEIGGASLAIRFVGIFLLGHGADQGVRYFSHDGFVGAMDGDIGEYTQLVFSVTIALPHRIRMAIGDPDAVRKLPAVYMKGCRLWLTHPGFIRTLDFDSGDLATGHDPIRPGYTIVQDDRDRIAFAVARLATWYGQERRNASWSLRACYAVPWYPDLGDGSGAADLSSPQTLPQLGSLPAAIAAGGVNWALNTPITRIHFNATKHLTTWFTDWSELDLA